MEAVRWAAARDEVFKRLTINLALPSQGNSLWTVKICEIKISFSVNLTPHDA